MKATLTIDLDESPVFTMKDVTAIEKIALEEGISEGEVITQLAKEALEAKKELPSQAS